MSELIINKNNRLTCNCSPENYYNFQPIFDATLSFEKDKVYMSPFGFKCLNCGQMYKKSIRIDK